MAKSHQVSTLYMYLPARVHDGGATRQSETGEAEDGTKTKSHGSPRR